ncbi:hypothetical protein A2Z00_04480 [Candidatus Gottesmanbacteria bacterium RBG_13_45_10]|uniref:Peptidase M14 carboxypeptidase A domain-containing protein n=1 Tax=Candidatus Gottesmanbacteria bacterium RBG_13_45_10 TaxID=1798370 RepID=A0A1F5ZHK8_9BACT|nr:MAG: hypothetical protein A2Z00_04480 [Candidatus Gottesmanbacteria bacterium RBG_13_45_10]
MVKHASHYKATTLFYYQSSQKPRLLVVSGFHGDEAGVIAPLTDFITSNPDRLPPFLFVPVASPSAVARGMRLSTHNVDMNRSYFPNTSVEEAQALMHFLEGRTFDMAYSFHEHPGETRFYLYDMGRVVDGKKMATLNEKMDALGVPLFDGIDDDQDPALGRKITRGYASESPDVAVRHGFFNGFLFTSHTTTRHVNLEIPGAVSTKKKAAIVAAIFDTLG